MGEPVSRIDARSDNILIGIDPGKTTGICILDATTRKILELHTLDFWKTYRFFLDPADNLQKISQVYIEQPSLIKSLYARHATRLVETQAKIVTRDKIVWDAGGNAREGILLRDGLRELGYTVFDSKPVGRKKWNASQFSEIMNYPDRSNQHVRDAAFLVHDKPWRVFL